MWIVSQNKRDIINYQFTQRIGLDRENNFTSINVYQNGNASTECMLLGAYKTEERAKEVLQEIIKTGMFTEQYKIEDERTQIKLMMKGVLLYEMPKE